MLASKQMLTVLISVGLLKVLPRLLVVAACPVAM